MNEMMQGLAGQGQQGMDSVKEIVMLLMDGARPEDLIAANIPQELVEAAMAEVQKIMESSKMGQQTPDDQAGLANGMIGY